jgi:hypothetical protein
VGINLPPNRQSKVPGLGSDQRTTKQSIMAGAPNCQAQDDSGYGSIGLGGITDNQPGHTVRLTSCAKSAQDSGSNAAGFQGIAGTINKGTPDWSGRRSAPTYSGPGTSAGTAKIDNSGDKSVQGFRTPSGRHIDGSNPDQGVASGMLFPGIIE